MDGGEHIPFHIPIGDFGASSATATKDAPTPTIEVAEGGPHRITVTPREGAGVLLDRIMLRDEAGKVVAEIEAEDAPPVPGELVAAAPAQRFRVIADGKRTAS